MSALEEKVDKSFEGRKIREFLKEKMGQARIFPPAPGHLAAVLPTRTHAFQVSSRRPAGQRAPGTPLRRGVLPRAPGQPRVPRALVLGARAPWRPPRSSRSGSCSPRRRRRWPRPNKDVCVKTTN